MNLMGMRGTRDPYIEEVGTIPDIYQDIGHPYRGLQRRPATRRRKANTQMGSGRARMQTPALQATATRKGVTLKARRDAPGIASQVARYLKGRKGVLVNGKKVKNARAAILKLLKAGKSVKINWS